MKTLKLLLSAGIAVLGIMAINGCQKENTETKDEPLVLISTKSDAIQIESSACFFDPQADSLRYFKRASWSDTKDGKTFISAWTDGRYAHELFSVCLKVDFSGPTAILEDVTFDRPASSSGWSYFDSGSVEAVEASKGYILVKFKEATFNFHPFGESFVINGCLKVTEKEDLYNGQ